MNALALLGTVLAFIGLAGTWYSYLEGSSEKSQFACLALAGFGLVLLLIGIVVML